MPRIYLGITPTAREIFRADATPTFATHGDTYNAVIGPFRTVRGALFMRDYGAGNPHCRTVDEAEHIASGQSYDIALGRWITKSED